MAAQGSVHYTRYVIHFSAQIYPTLRTVSVTVPINMSHTHTHFFMRTSHLLHHQTARYAGRLNFSNKFIEVTDVWVGKSQQSRTAMRSSSSRWKHDMNFMKVSSCAFPQIEAHKYSSAVPGYEVTYRQCAGRGAHGNFSNQRLAGGITTAVLQLCVSGL